MPFWDRWGELEEAAGAAVLSAGVRGQAWSGAVRLPESTGPVLGRVSREENRSARLHQRPSPASSLSSPLLENLVSLGPGSGARPRSRWDVWGESQGSEQGSWPPWLGPETQGGGSRPEDGRA